MTTDSPSARTSRRSAGLHSVLNLALVLGILLIINYLGFRHYAHKDLSASQFYALSPKTETILKNLTSPVTIYTFLDANSPQADQIFTLLKEYQRIGGKNIDVEKIDPAFDLARAKNLQSKLHFDGNDSLVIFEYKDAAPQFVKVEDLYDINPVTRQGVFKGEQLFTSTLMTLLEGKTAKVYFTVGHGEHPFQDSTARNGYGIVGDSLKNENIGAASLSIAQKGEIPADAEAVVIAGPSIAFSPIEVDALDRYLANNGKLLVLLDPYVVSGLNDLLKKYAMKYEDDMVLWRTLTTTGTETTVPMAYIYQSGFSQQPITAKFAQSNMQLLIQTARSITILPNEKASPKTQFLLQTDPTAWGWITKGNTMPESPRDLTYNKITDIPGPMIVAAVYDGGPITDPNSKATLTATRVITVGSSKFLQNDTADVVGKNFFTNCLNWLVKKNAVLEISPKKPQEYGVSLTPMQFRTVVWCALFFIPGAALAMGIFTWFSRRK